MATRMEYPLSSIAAQRGPADGDQLTIWAGIQGTDTHPVPVLPYMEVVGQRSLWEKVADAN